MGAVSGRSLRSSSWAGPETELVRFGEVMEAAARRERWAVDHIVGEYLGRLAAFARNRGAADPDGIADVALFSVLNRLDELRFETPEQLWAYLCLTARSRVIDAKRATRPVELVDDQTALERPNGHASAFDDQIVDRALVAELLAPLTDEQRRVMELRFLEDRSIEETANLTGRTTGAVKGLQRRAINAIIAAVAVIAAAVAFQLLSGNGTTIELDSDPIGRIDGDEAPQETPTPTSTPSPTSTLTSAPTAALTVEIEGGATDGEAESDANSTVAPGSSQPATDRHTVTVGTDDQTSLDTSGLPVPESNHGARNYCAVSHLANGDPFGGDAPGLGPAQIYWGNTAADATAATIELSTVGSATCEGGIADRSAHWMPALFDAADDVMLPEMVMVEYKAFGGGQLDRNALGPIPVGLHLVASADIVNHIDRYTRVDGEDQIRLKVLFPSCVATTGDGRPVLTDGRLGAHLSYPTPNANGPTECPSSHPYRIPTLYYTLVYDLGVDDDWYLASSDGSQRGRDIVAGAISAWQPAAMEAMVTCVRDLIGDCGFVGFDEAGNPESRGQLPERFVGPGGQVVYRTSVALADGVDRTPDQTGIVPFAAP